MLIMVCVDDYIVVTEQRQIKSKKIIKEEFIYRQSASVMP